MAEWQDFDTAPEDGSTILALELNWDGDGWDLRLASFSTADKTWRDQDGRSPDLDYWLPLPELPMTAMQIKKANEDAYWAEIDRRLEERDARLAAKNAA
jgi:hypothetical protein